MNPNDPQKSRKKCRCGNATNTPGKLTCCGQRCPCYVDSKACVDCKCKGCRNPHYVDGHKKVFNLLILKSLLQWLHSKHFILDAPSST